MIGLDPESLESLDGATRIPFSLTLQGDPSGTPKRFECQEVMRVLPGRRHVLVARVDGERVVLKLFTGSAQQRYLRREQQGLKQLAETGVPATRILEQVRGPGVVGLVLRYLPDAQAIETHDQSALIEIANMLGRMHGAGVWQADLHLDNFLRSDGRIHAIDGDGIRASKRPLALSHGLDNLAVLAAQRPPVEDARVDELLDAYGQGRRLPLETLDRFRLRLDEARRQRVRRYLKKAQRSCTEFAVERSWRAWKFALRGRGEAPLEQLLADPDGVMEAGQLLKAGNSATLVRTAGPNPVIVKRFNIKGLRHALRRMLRPLPRFRRAWLSGQLLHFLEIPTARPIALLEQRVGPWRGVAYLVMEDLEGRDLGAEVAAVGLSEARCTEVAELFALLKAVGLNHGDTKASNFLVRNDKVYLIDLDAMGTSAIDKDLQRFLDNWRGAEKARFEASFRRAGLL